MREILFRGKRVATATFVHGFYVLLADRSHSIVNDNGNYWVIPETVGQFTGKTDKNGKKIFEGDIIRAFGEIYACRWDDGNIEFSLSSKHESFGIAYVAGYDMEVIGNIYDNPELLEG